MDSFDWLDWWWSTLDDGMVMAIEAGVYAGLLAVVVLAINILMRRWLSAGQLGLLWGLVLLRLVMPVVPASSLSLEGLLTLQGESPEAQSAAAARADLVIAPQPFPKPYQDLSGLSEPAAATSAADEAQWIEAVFFAIPFVWAIGGAAGLVFTLTNYAQFRRRVNCVPDCQDARLTSLWAKCRRLANVKRTMRIKHFEGIEQPAVMGVFRPTLLLPLDASELDDEQLRMVMLHELAHVRRWDVAANWLLIVIRAVYWWNPVYWLAAARFRSLREQACDAFVVRQLTNQTTQNYGELLLSLVKRQPMSTTWRVLLPATILSFFPQLFRQRAIRARIKALRRAGLVRGRWHAAAVAILLALVTVSGFTIAREAVEEPINIPTWMAKHPEVVLAPKRSYEVREKYDGPRETREYDIAACLDKIAEETKSKDKARQLFEIMLKQLFPRTVLTVVTPLGSQPERTTTDNPANAETTTSDQSPLTYTIEDTKLSATAPAALHERLRRTLAAWGESGLEQIAVETRFLDANSDLVSELGISWQFLEAFSSEREAQFPTTVDAGAPVVRAEARVDEYLPLVVATLDADQAEKLLEIAQRDARTNVLNAPRVTVFNGQEAMIADCWQTPFVVGVFKRVAGANEPKIVVLDQGTKVNVRATKIRDSKKLRLEASIDMRSLGEVAKASTVYRGDEVSIQVPSVKRRSIDVAAEIESGQTLLVGCIPTRKDQKYSYYLLSATQIAESQ